ncbi:MAG: protein kinase [Trueperaceae bacterium]|nr:protein kinase [Trueperaceae bacterium]
MLTIDMLVKREVIDNRYQSLDLLGQGGMGLVYRATDLETDQDVAIKLLTLPPGESQLRFRREFRVMSRLSHPNVIEVFGSGTHDSVPFLVMRLLSGGTLTGEFGGGVQSLEDVAVRLELLAQVADALAYIHGEGIIHRDLKPDNIMLEPQEDGDPRAILMDFGLAKTDNDETRMLTQPGAIMGTASYMSPEQVRGTGVDARSDLYAFGCLAVWMMTGEPPFVGRSFTDVLVKQLNEPAQPPSLNNAYVPAALDDVVLKLLEKDPTDRYSVASDVAKALRDIRRTQTGQDDASVETTTSVTPMRLFETPLIGRDQPWQRALRALGNLPHSGQLLRVGAASGLGLSRFLRELRREARAHDYQVLQVSYHDGVGVPYQAWRNGLGAFAERYPEALAAARQGLEPALSLLLPDLSFDAPPAEVPADIAQLRLYDAVDKLLTRLTRDQPIVVIVDNAHFADEGSLGLMAYLARGLEHNPLFLAYGYHESQLQRPARKTLDGLEGERVALEPLSDDATRELLSALLGGELEPRLERYLLERVAGNPFFAEEVLLAMLRDGSLTRQAGFWEWEGEATIAVTSTYIPQRIEDVFMQRLERLSESAQKSLRVASAIGRNFYFETLQQLLDVDEDALLDDIDELLRANLIEERSADLYRFSHLLLRETLHDSLNARRRRRYHQNIADMLRSRADVPPSELAEHYAETANPQLAAPFALRAARNAERIYTNDVAERFYRLYLAVTPEDDPERPDVQLELSAVLERVGSWDEAENLLHDLTPDPNYQVRALARLGTLMQKRGELSQSETYLREAIAADPNSPALYSHLGRTLAQKGDLNDARQVLNLALAFASQKNTTTSSTPGPSDLTSIQIDLAELKYQAGQDTAAIEFLDKAQENITSDDKAHQARIFLLLSNAHFRLGDLELAKTYLENAQTLYHEIGDIERATMIKQNLANVLAAMGAPEKAIDTGREVQRQARRLGNKKLEALAAFNQGAWLCNLGRYQDAITPLQEAKGMFQRLEMRYLKVHASLALVTSYSHTQRFSEAQAEIEAATALLKGAPQPYYRALSLYYRGEFFLQFGQASRAVSCLQESIETFSELQSRELMFDSYLALATAYLVLGQPQTCNEQLDAATELAASFNEPHKGLRIAYLRALSRKDPDDIGDLRDDLTDAGLGHIVNDLDAVLVANEHDIV